MTKIDTDFAVKSLIERTGVKAACPFTSDGKADRKYGV